MTIQEWIERLEGKLAEGGLTPPLRDAAFLEWSGFLSAVIGSDDPVSQFEGVKAVLRRSPMNEAPLSRVWDHATNGNGLVLLSAFRPNTDRKTNVANNVRLASEIRSAGYGYFWVDGVWKDKKTGIEYPEDSILVVGDGDDARLLRNASAWRRAYDQDAVLVVLGSLNKGRSPAAVSANLIWRSGSVEIKRAFSRGDAAEFFTKLRDRSTTADLGKFTFGESTLRSYPSHVIPSNWVHAMALSCKAERESVGLSAEDEAERQKVERMVASATAE